MLKVRRAQASDDEAIGNLLVESFGEAYARKLPEVVVSSERIKDLRDVASKRGSTDVAVLVAEFGTEIVGTVTVFGPEAASRAWTPRTAELRYMAIRSDFQGKGLSSLLLRESLMLAQEWGASAICLHVRRSAVGVAKMYQANGYVRVPEGDVDLLPDIFLEAYLLRLNSA